MLKTSGTDIARRMPSGSNAIADFLNRLMTKVLSRRRTIGRTQSMRFAAAVVPTIRRLVDQSTQRFLEAERLGAVRCQPVEMTVETVFLGFRSI